MATHTIHESYMSRALDLARCGWGQTHPNPMVGAVIVDRDKIVAEGWHRADGQPHAEIEALNALEQPLSDKATLYVTLEPCSTCGRTGACTDTIIRSGIRKVVIGAMDPNPIHAGRGIRILSEAGVQVVTDVLSRECTDLNLIFNHWIVHRTPFFAAKMATTLDGKFAAANGCSKWITGEEARADVMQWRRCFPAIAVSGQTVLTDDPRLTSRQGEKTWSPRRLVFDRMLNTASAIEKLQIYNDEFASRTTVVCREDAEVSAFEAKGIGICRLPEDSDGHLDLNAFRRYCADELIYGVYIEPGPDFMTALIERKAVDYIFHYFAPGYLLDSLSRGFGRPRNTTNIEERIRLQDSRSATFGNDFLIRGYL